MDVKRIRDIPVSQQNFKVIRVNNQVYIDKTKKIYELFRMSGGSYFLSRPRRFGKSLLCSTLRELFLGNRELFKGLWIDTSDWEWKKHPVIHLDMTSASGAGKSVKEVEEGLLAQLSKIAHEHGLVIEETKQPDLFLSQIFYTLNTKYGLGVVVIIDEYDKPMLDSLGYPEHMKNNHMLLQRFYAQLKNSSEYLHFVFLTGVYKFAQTSVFSGLNNIQDLTFNVAAGDLCGYTQEEIESNFGLEIDALTQETSLSRTNLLMQLRENYNGYVFGYKVATGTLSQSVYNSFAINNVFAQNEMIQGGWFRTGSPSFLIKQLELRDFEPVQIDKMRISTSILLNSCEPDKINAETLLYYAGYATIKSYSPDNDLIELRFPNKEVSKAMAEEILPRMTDKSLTMPKQAALDVRDAWRNDDFEAVKENLNICLAMLHNKLYTSRESYFQTVIMMFLHVADIRVEPEYPTNKGYADLIVWLKNKIYVVEIKMDCPLTEALDQIRDRKYYKRLQAEKLPITLVGMVCSKEERAVTQLKVEILEKC